MTEKVVSLSGGLVLGMISALLLGIGSSQHIVSSQDLHFPTNIQMTIAQHPNSNNQVVPEQESTPVTTITTSEETSDQERGRITRIASLTTTSNPALDSEEGVSKKLNTNTVFNNSLYRANQQRSIISDATITTTVSGITFVSAKQSNFTSVAISSSGRASGTFYENQMNNKPQAIGSPSLAHDDPGLVNPHGSPSPSVSNSGKDKDQGPSLVAGYNLLIPNNFTENQHLISPNNLRNFSPNLQDSGQSDFR